MKPTIRLAFLGGLCFLVLCWISCHDDFLPDFAYATLEFEGFDEHVGQRFTIVQVRIPTDNVFVPLVIDSIPASSFSARLLVTEGYPYQFDFYADVNGNGHYDPPPTDHAWRIRTGGRVQGDFVIVFQHDDNYVDIQFPD